VNSIFLSLRKNLPFLFLPRTFRFFLRALYQAGKGKLGLKVLRTLDLELTYACPLHCTQCYSYTTELKRPLLTPENFLPIAKEARELGAIHLNLSGGEPLLRKDLEGFIEIGRRMGFLVSLCTSGYTLGEERLAELAKAGLNLLILSLDSLDPHGHDENRGIPGLALHVLELLFLAPCYRIGVMINTVATGERLKNGELLRMADWAEQRGVLLNLTVPVPQGRLEGRRSVLLSPEERTLFFQLLHHPAVRTDFLGSYRGIGCPAGGEKITLDPYGNIHPCPLLRKEYGNVFSAPLRELWERIVADRTLPYGYPFCPAGAIELWQGS
jgi:MoaA/NifB/PqqE/SkfB family radical SAM enzyme